MKRKKHAPAHTVPPAVLAAMQDNTHLHSSVVARNRQLAEFQLRQTQTAIAALQVKLAEERASARELEQRIDGMAAVLSSRAV